MKTMPAARSFVKDEEGVVAIVVALALPLIMGFATLAVDIGHLVYTQARLQATADAAALAAVSSLTDTTEATSRATTIAALNMSANSYGTVVNGSDVVFGNWDDSTRVFTAAATPLNAVRVTARRTAANGNAVALFFAPILGINTKDVVASAVAAQTSTTGGDCILSTHPTAAGGVTINGTVNLSLGCGISVTSTHSTQAFKVSGSSGTIDATSICVAGGSQVSGQGNNFVTASPSDGCTPPSDPLSGLAAPPEASSACQYNNYSISGSGSTINLSPGVYCGGITISGSGNTVNFSAGTYVIAGGGFSVSGASTLNGSEVMFYNTKKPSGSPSWGDIDFSGNSTVNFSAPTSGDYAGVLFFQDPSTESANANVEFKVSGTVNMTNLDGVIYMPNHEVEFSGTASVSKTCATKIIASTIEFSGTSDTGGTTTGCASDNVTIGGSSTYGLKA